MSKTEQTEKKLAEKYGCTTRTIRNWRAEGAPLGSEKKMQQWLSTRKNAPQGVDRTFKIPKLKPTETPEETKLEIKTGVAMALRRLEKEEQNAYETFQAAVEEGDPLAIKWTRDNWLKISESLRRYDLLVEQSRRDSGELIQRVTAESALEMSAWWLNNAIKNCASALPLKLANLQSKEELKVAQTIENSMTDMLSHSMVSAASHCSTLSLNKWATQAVLRGLGAIDYPGRQEGLFDVRLKILKGLIEYNTARSAEKHGGQKAESVFHYLEKAMGEPDYFSNEINNEITNQTKQ